MSCKKLCILKSIWETISFIGRFILIVIGAIAVLAPFYYYSVYKDLAQESDEIEAIDYKGALLINIDGDLNTNKINDPKNVAFYNSFGLSVKQPGLSLWDVVNSIHKAEKDDNITGIVLDLTNSEFSLSTINELYSAIKSFKKNAPDKKIVALSEFGFSGSDYIVASLADKIYLSTFADVNFYGEIIGGPFLKDFYDKYGIKPYTTTIASKYSLDTLFQTKSDVDDDFLVNAKVLTNQTWDLIVNKSIEKRNLDKNIFYKNIDEQSSIYANYKNTLDYYIENKVVDGYGSLIDLTVKLHDIFGDNKDKDPAYVGYAYHDIEKYAKTLDKVSTNKKSNHIAVLNLNGLVGTSGGPLTSINAKSIISNLEKNFIENKSKNKFNGLLIRLDSVGGSLDEAFNIYNTLIKVKEKTGIPIVVSAGSNLNSAAYLIASAADSIVAYDSTFVGGIQASIIGPNSWYKPLLELGINTDNDTVTGSGIRSYNIGLPVSIPLYGASADYKEYSVVQQEIYNANVLHLYNEFKKIVSNNRKLDFEALENSAQGKIFLAHEAVERGLIDSLGDYNSAINTLKDLILEKNKLDKEKYKATQESKKTENNDSKDKSKSDEDVKEPEDIDVNKLVLINYNPGDNHQSFGIFSKLLGFLEQDLNDHFGENKGNLDYLLLQLKGDQVNSVCISCLKYYK